MTDAHETQPMATARRIAWSRRRELHAALGLIGNVCFLLGSALFLWEATFVAGVWSFIVGSACALLGGLGRSFAATPRDTA